MEAIKIGEKLADFVLEDQNGSEFRLSESSGKKVLLSFHPLAWTSVCAEQMKSLEKNQEKFKELNVVAVGLSVDSAPSKKAWSQSLAITNTRLLADFWPHGKVAIDLGIFLEKKGVSGRVNIIIDENQNVSYIKIYPLAQLPDIEEIIRLLQNEQG